MGGGTERKKRRTGNILFLSAALERKTQSTAKLCSVSDSGILREAQQHKRFITSVTLFWDQSLLTLLWFAYIFTNCSKISAMTLLSSHYLFKDCSRISLIRSVIDAVTDLGSINICPFSFRNSISLWDQP